MRDDKELRLVGHAAHILSVARDVRLVECRLYLVHYAERCGAHLEYREIQRYRNECHLAAGEQAQVRQRLSRRLHLYLYSAVEHVVFVLKPERGLAAAEELKEGLAEALVYLLEAPDEDLLHLARDLLDDADKLTLSLCHVVALPTEEAIALADSVVFLYRAEVRRTEGVYLTAQLADELVRLRQALHRLAHRLRRSMAQLIVFPELVHYLLFFHVGGKLLLLYPRDLAFEVKNVAVALLRLLVGAGALALKLHLAAAYLCDLVLDGLGLFVYRGDLRFLFLQPLVEAVYLPLVGFHRLAPRLAVSGEAFEQELQLRRGAFHRAFFRFE